MEKTYVIGWSPGAERDLECLDCHRARRGELAEQKLKDEILVAVRKLAQFPEFGRALRFLGPGWRQLLCRPYRIIYFIHHDSQTVFISRIWHASRAEPAEEDLIPLS
jgi:plasmid stabilization system protein ParE